MGAQKNYFPNGGKGGGKGVLKHLSWGDTFTNTKTFIIAVIKFSLCDFDKSINSLKTQKSVTDPPAIRDGGVGGCNKKSKSRYYRTFDKCPPNSAAD